MHIHPASRKGVPMKCLQRACCASLFKEFMHEKFPYRPIKYLPGALINHHKKFKNRKFFEDMIIFMCVALKSLV